MWKRVRQFVVVAAVCGLAGCVQSEKSSHPLSPDVAGPIPGVAITAPGLVQPDGGPGVSVDQQPITLVVTNSTTTGVRPISYRFELGTDPSFTTLLYSREGIAPGDGRTSLRLTDSLTPGRTYFWRSRAQDGANAGPWSGVASFKLFIPVTIGAPTLVAPIGNATTRDTRPRFTVANAPRSGPAGAIQYIIEIAEDANFATKTAIWAVGEQQGQTGLDAPVNLAAGKQYFWHARATDQSTTGPWSDTAAFSTPFAGGSGGGGACSAPSANDQMTLSSATVWNSPADISCWPATTKITRLEMSPTTGLSFQFSAQSSWPNYTPPGWDGPLQYTVWAVVKVNGTWQTSGFIQMWRGRVSTGAPIIAEFGLNWAYDARWGPMDHYQPSVGEQMGFFVSAGDARGQGVVTSVRERSNVVVVPLPAGDSGVFTW